MNHLLSVRAILKTNRYKISHKSIVRVKCCFTFPGEIAISSIDGKSFLYMQTCYTAYN